MKQPRTTPSRLIRSAAYLTIAAALLAALPILEIACSNHTPSAAPAVNSISAATKSANFEVNTATGGYTIINPATGWRFTGNIGHPITDSSEKQDTDRIGHCKVIELAWNDDGPVAGEIRCYLDQPIVRFRLICQSPRSNPLPSCTRLVIPMVSSPPSASKAGKARAHGFCSTTAPGRRFSRPRPTS
jgi:hypothetical protein